jgi:hypothetical protein
MSLRFDPPKQVARYALFVDHGNGKGFFKTYNELGFAKMALGHHNYGMSHDAKILENVEGQWYVLFDVPARTPSNNLPWKKVRTSWRWHNSESKVSKPMTRDEYAEWRLAVERERIADLSADISLNN